MLTNWSPSMVLSHVLMRVARGGPEPHSYGVFETEGPLAGPQVLTPEDDGLLPSDTCVVLWLQWYAKGRQAGNTLHVASDARYLGLVVDGLVNGVKVCDKISMGDINISDWALVDDEDALVRRVLEYVHAACRGTDR